MDKQKNYKKLMWHQVNSNKELMSKVKQEIVGIIYDARSRSYYKYDWNVKCGSFRYTREL